MEQLLPLYYLYGDDSFLIQKAIEKIKGRILDSSTASFNYDVFRGGDLELGKVLNIAVTSPLLSQKRIILVKEAELIKEKDLHTLIPYLKNPSEFTIVIFWSRQKKIHEENIFFKEFKRKGKLICLNHPKEIVSYIKKEVEKFGKKIGLDAINLLVQTLGNDLQSIHNELEKLFLYVGEKKIVTVSDVEKVVSQVKMASIFALTEALGRQQCPKALSLLKEMLDGGEIPLVILGMIARQLRLILKTKLILQKGASSKEIEKELKVPFYLAKELLKQAKNFSFSQLKEDFAKIFHTDLALKSSPLPSSLLLEKLIIELCGR